MKTTNAAKEALEAKGIKFETPRLELAKKDEHDIPQSTGKHFVTILRDEKRTDIRLYTSGTGYKEVTGIRYWFDEAGVEKYYDVPLIGKDDKPHYLIAHFSEINEGDKLEMEYVKKGKGGFIEVKKAGTGKVDGEIPTIQLDEDNEDARPSLGGAEDISLDDLPF